MFMKWYFTFEQGIMKHKIHLAICAGIFLTQRISDELGAESV